MCLLKHLLTCIEIFCSSYAVISSSLCFLRPLAQDLEYNRQNRSNGVLCCVFTVRKGALCKLVAVESLSFLWYCEQKPALAFPGGGSSVSWRRLKCLAESKDRDTFGPTFPLPAAHEFPCLLHFSLLLTLASCISYLVHMAEHDCQLLLNFTCYVLVLNGYGEIDVRLPVPLPEFLGKGLTDPARVSCPLWDCGQTWGHITGIWQSLFSLWMGVGQGESLKKNR